MSLFFDDLECLEDDGFDQDGIFNLGDDAYSNDGDSILEGGDETMDDAGNPFDTSNFDDEFDPMDMNGMDDFTQQDLLTYFNPDEAGGDIDI